VLLVVLGILLSLPAQAENLPNERLNAFAKRMVERHSQAIGYPVNQNVEMKDFYRWYIESGLADVAMNNVGNPRKDSPYSLNTHEYENEVIDFFAPGFGFEPAETWGIVTASGTDGNNHGIYFGVKYLLAKTKMRPVLYVSDEAHYSIKKLGDLQNLDLRLIPSDEMGRMRMDEFEKALDPSKPALVVVAIGTTFKGAIDDQVEIDAILAKKRPLAVYRHLDAALFGGYLPFSEHKDIINRKKIHFDSVAVSGHKFFGFDEPLGFFITSNEVLNNQNPFKVNYLTDAVPTITCSRSALAALKFWWKVKRTGREGFQKQAAQLLQNTKHLKARLDEIKYPAWVNPYSNTVFFKRPSPEIMKKWDLAPEEDPRFGGPLAHEIVMQHETPDVMDRFLEDLKKDLAGGKI
jgi:histidine decarboxylase